MPTRSGDSKLSGGKHWYACHVPWAGHCRTADDGCADRVAGPISKPSEQDTNERRQNMPWRIGLILIALTGLGRFASAAPTQWKTIDEGNAHYYDRIDDATINWTQTLTLDASADKITQADTD